MLITEMEMIGLVRSSVLHTARKLKIADAEWKTTEELLAEIQSKDDQTHKLLNDFLGAYWAWYNFHKRIETVGKQGNLDREEHEELTHHVGNRNRRREAILQRLAGLP